MIIQYNHGECNLFWTIARQTKKMLKMKYRSILIAVQLTIVAKDLNLRKEKLWWWWSRIIIRVMTILVPNPKNSPLLQQPCLGWCALSPGLGLHPSGAPPRRPDMRLVTILTKMTKTIEGFGSLLELAIHIWFIRIQFVSYIMHKPNVRNGFPPFEWNESWFICH